MRTLQDGTKMAPKRGTPPPIPEGYERADGDPFTFYPLLFACDRREEKIDLSGCCGDYKRKYCTELQMATDRLMCSQCQGKTENLSTLLKERATVYVEGHHGWGDNVYQYPLIAAMKHYTIYLRTTWPDLYWNLPHVKCVHPDTKYRTQKKHIAQHDGWSQVPHGIRQIYLGYTHQNGNTVTRDFENQLGIPFENIPISIHVDWRKRADDWLTKWNTDKPIAIIHMPTVRREWPAPSRNCKPEYIQTLIDEIKDTHFTVSIADVKPHEEWFEKVPDNCDRKYHKGELGLATLITLCSDIDLMIGPVGNMLPIGLSTGCKTIMVFGGFVKPESLIDERYDLSNFHVVAPEPFCDCVNRSHDCNKEVSREKLVRSLEWNRPLKNS